jgi:PLD-like domain
MTGLSRQIFKNAGRASIDVAEALGNLLVAEILDPGNEFYVVSAWISDVPVLDNSAGAFSMLDPEWEERWLYLSEVLVTLMKRNVLVRVKTNEDPHNRAFVERLESRAATAGTAEQCQVRSRADAHSKGIAGGTFALRGSMNLTYNGLREREETVEIDVDTEAVATLRLEFSAEWKSGIAA